MLEVCTRVKSVLCVWGVVFWECVVDVGDGVCVFVFKTIKHTYLKPHNIMSLVHHHIRGGESACLHPIQKQQKCTLSSMDLFEKAHTLAKTYAATCTTCTRTKNACMLTIRL